MEKRFMKSYLKYFMIGITCVGLCQFGLANSKKKKSNIDRFVLVPFQKAVHQDSIQIISFIEIPFSSLQFVKSEHGFVAGYQASISLKDKKGNDLGHEIWSDSILVDAYSDTRSPVKNRKHFTTHTIPKGHKYELVGEVQDTDTRKKGTQNRKINLSPYKNSPILMNPTFLLHLSGDWGYGEGKIPTRGYKVRETGQGVILEISGFISPEPAEILVSISNGLVVDSLIASHQFTSREGYFIEEVFIPTELLQSLKNEFEVHLIQGRRDDVKFISFSTFKTGISNFVHDLDIAMRQMKYILNNEEKLSLKKLNKNEVEQQFYLLWKKRDPTPETEYNELMEEYYGRVWYANEHFDAWQPGWETDRGMIYILFGAPNEVQRTNPVSTNTSAMYQVWYYYNLNKQFVFKDQNGFGDFRLETPFIGAGL